MTEQGASTWMIDEIDVELITTVPIRLYARFCSPGRSLLSRDSILP